MFFSRYARFFRPEDWNTLRAFIIRHTHERYVLADKTYFDWQFAPPASGGLPSVLVLENARQILGYLGVLPVRLNYFGREIRGAYLANLMTDYSLRNKGAGVGLIEKAQAEGGGVVYTTGYIPPVDTIYNHLGWAPEVIFKRFVFILNQAKVAELMGAPADSVRPGSRPAWPFGSALTFVEQGSFDSRVDAFWIMARSKYPITIIRDQEYLNWRYAKNPLLSYRLFLGLKNNQVESFLVVRIEEAGSYKIGRIIDFMSTDDAEQFMLANLVEFCRRQEVDLIDFLFTGSFHLPALKGCGFREGNQPPYSLIPIRFNPIDRRIMTINFTYKFLAPSLQVQQGTSDRHWYVTKGDGDQDRPNPH